MTLAALMDIESSLARLNRTAPQSGPCIDSDIGCHALTTKCPFRRTSNGPGLKSTGARHLAWSRRTSVLAHFRENDFSVLVHTFATHPANGTQLR